MKIVSKFNDYYDCIQSYGFDDSCIYIRKKEDIIVHPMDYPFIGELERWGGLNERVREVGSGRFMDITVSILLYCGEIRPIIKLSSQQDTKLATSVKEFEDALNYFKSIKDGMFNRAYNAYHAKPPKWENDVITLRKHRIKELFELKMNVGSIFHDEGCPILYLKLPLRYYGFSSANKPLTITKNPSLSNLKFFRQKSESEAFTDIRNYITQQLGGNSPQLVDISDKSKIVKKGFDVKTSFRKAPTKRKKK